MYTKSYRSIGVDVDCGHNFGVEGKHVDGYKEKSSTSLSGKSSTCTLYKRTKRERNKDSTVGIYVEIITLIVSNFYLILA